MAAKGTVTKQKITQKILEAFPGSFLYNDGKEIRINDIEDGLPIQIKISLTAAKVMVEGGSDVTLPGEVKAPTTAVTSTSLDSIDDVPFDVGEKVPAEPSEEEKQRLVALLDRLGLS